MESAVREKAERAVGRERVHVAVESVRMSAVAGRRLAGLRNRRALVKRREKKSQVVQEEQVDHMRAG